MDLLLVVVMQLSNNSDHSISSSIWILFETVKRDECDPHLLLLCGPMHVGVLIIFYMYFNQVLLEGVREITFFI